MQINGGCDVLTAEQVQEILGSANVVLTDAGLGSTEFQGCLYQSDGRFVLDFTVSRGQVGDGQEAADSAAAAAASGATERIDGIGEGAAYFPADAQGGLVVAFDGGGEDLVLVTLQGEVSRDQLVNLGRAVEQNVTPE